ncbi:sarcosine oxidase subunit gamma family protein [Thalassobius sp. I31.1]|uniref:sarcosine oxidase subunit gamma n=1 Tax=Thalassobius sp. I31.1 TaxID=2109912 RepID=UPI000D1AE6DA|nr:sarcosine oxidase subunit gamma family protein [Thalassobius sp. I31.1]
MSEAIKATSALEGFASTGFASVREAGLTGMITLRGDLADKALIKAVKDATGAAMPEQRKITTGTSGKVAWMSPDELLLVVDHAQAPGVVDALSTALKDQFAMAVNVSDARVMFEVSGEGAAPREVLAKLAPVDLATESFGVGDVRRTRLAQVAGAFWVEEDGAFRVVAFRSVAQYVGDLLAQAAETGSAPEYL